MAYRYKGMPFEAVIREGDCIKAIDVATNGDLPVIVYARKCPDGSIQVMGVRELTNEEVERYARTLSDQRPTHLQLIQTNEDSTAELPEL